MKTIILAGGKGTRLAPYNTIFPKPLMPLGDRAILDIIIQQLEHLGFSDIIISLGYLGELIEAYIRNGSPHVVKANISFVREREPLGTVGALSLVHGLDETFMSINGDTLTTLDYRKLVEHHKKSNSIMTIAVNKKDIKIDFGVIETNENDFLVNFTEKPHFQYKVGMGVYVYEPEVLKYIAPGQRFDFPDLVWKILEDGKRISTYNSDDYWLDLGTHMDYEKAQSEYELMKGKLLPV